ncbi:hypothetical protein AB0425_17595 [Actinosynnema sp. NPDC051121]
MSPVIRRILAIHAIALGAGYLAGPVQWYSGSTFTVVRSLGVPIPLWGAVFVLAGVLLAVGRPTAGHALALAAFAFWGGALAASIPQGQLSAWGSPVHNLLVAAPLHALGLWQRRQSRVDRRAGRT